MCLISCPCFLSFKSSILHIYLINPTIIKNLTVNTPAVQPSLSKNQIQGLLGLQCTPCHATRLFLMIHYQKSNLTVFNSVGPFSCAKCNYFQYYFYPFNTSHLLFEQNAARTWSAHFFDLFANFDFCWNIPHFKIVCFRICESKSQIYLNSNIIQGVNTSVHMNSQNISPKIYGNAALHNEVAMPYYFLNGLDSSDDTHSATNLLFHADHDSSSFIFSIQIFFSQSAAQSKITGVQPVCRVKDPWNHFKRHPSIPYHTTPHHRSVQKSNSLSPAVPQ